MCKTQLLICLVFICTLLTPASSLGLDSEALFGRIVPTGYDKYSKPPDGPIGLFAVKCFFNPSAVTKISIKTMDITINVGLIFQWNDARLNSTGISPTMKLPDWVVAKLWYPRLIMGDCKTCKGKTYIKSGELSVFTNEKNEIVLYLKKITTLTCRFNMSSYPFDVQVCATKFVCTQVFSCLNLNVQYDVDPTLDITQVNMPPGYDLQTVGVMPCEAKMFSPETTCTAFYLRIKRVRVRPLLVIFLPSMLLVMISWISFWLDVQAAAPRVTLGLTVMLTLSTHFNSAQRDLPAVSTIMAVDVWMFSCIFIVFASLVEFAIVHFSNRSGSSNLVTSFPDISCFKNMSCNKPKKQHEKSNYRIGIKLDVISRVLFPFLFIIFNLIFWIHYCYN